MPANTRTLLSILQEDASQCNSPATTVENPKSSIGDQARNVYPVLFRG